MNHKPKLHLLFSGLATVLALLGASAAHAGVFSPDPRQPGTRSGRMSVYPMYQYYESQKETVSGLSFGDPAVPGNLVYEVESVQALGVGFGWEINNHWTLNGDLMFAYPDYKLSFNNATITGEGFMNTGTMNIDFNILRGRFTPFLTAGIGFHYFDSGIPAGPTIPVCWWDYWWGYVCTGATPTHVNTSFTYNGGGGLRWDINDQVFVKAAVSVQYVDSNTAANNVNLTRYSFAFGWKY